MPAPAQTKLSFVEKAGYSAADAAANFVFMTMILFQSNFYTDVFGITAGVAGTIILVARLWDAFFDPIMGVMADRTNTRWGKFRPWILFTALPWCVVMVLAYSTPKEWSRSAMITYAAVTNILLMTIYSANNMPYAALGGVMTGDVDERAKLNSFRFISVNAAQFIVGGFTLPLVAKFAGPEHNLHRGWQMTMSIWAALCLVLFLITFITCKERIRPQPSQKSTPKQDFSDLARNSPWTVMFCMTLVHFAILSLRGGAYYNYYHYYADKTALFHWLQSLHLTTTAPRSTGILETLGYIVHGDASSSNVADVANSIINMLGTAVVIIVILLSPSLSRAFGKKTVAVCGFGLTAFASAAFYILKPTDVGGMVALTIITSAVYAPTIPLIWAIYADVADYSEWKNGRRATGIIFATIGFALKAGLSLGSASFLWLMSLYDYHANQPQTPETLQGIRMCSSVYLAVLFGICTVLLISYKLNKRLTHQIADELAERRKNFALQNPVPEPL
ncbi:MAG TPA: MFS transporter [Verrucomicrobiae bacterium]|jgi:Na+/melibiose symporter-like transporter|nr:MFS transporter [Verrucomicrobiae bacterium]